MRKSKPRAIYCDTLWLQSFGTRNSSLGNATIYLSLYSFCSVLFWIWGQFTGLSPRRLIFGDLTESFLCYEFGVLIFGGAYFRNFTVLYRPLFNYYDCFFSLTNLIGPLRTVLDIFELNKSHDHRGQIVFPCRYHTYLEQRTQSASTNTRKRTQFFQIYWKNYFTLILERHQRLPRNGLSFP